MSQKPKAPLLHSTICAWAISDLHHALEIAPVPPRLPPDPDDEAFDKYYRDLEQYTLECVAWYDGPRFVAVAVYAAMVRSGRLR